MPGGQRSPELENFWAVLCQNEATNLLPSWIFSKHSVTNHVGLLYYCDAPLLAPIVAIDLHAAWQQYRLFNVYVCRSYRQQFCHDIGTWKNRWTLSMRYFTTINHVAADDSFFLQQDIALAHHACNTVNLLERELSTSLLSIIDLPLAAQQRTSLV